MINHFRSLLLNVAGGSSGYPGEELIPASFRPVELSGALRSVRRVLFGDNPDRLMLNYRAHQLLSVVHATELRQFVTAVDSRITYDLERSTVFYTHPFALQAVQGSGDVLRIYYGGEPELIPDVVGRCRHTWRVLFNGDGTAVVVRRTPPISEQVCAYTVTDSLSTPVPLTGTGFYFTFDPVDDMSAWTTFTEEQWRRLTAAEWRGLGGEIEPAYGTNPTLTVTADIRPQRDPGALLVQLDALGEPVQLQLFGVGSRRGGEEPLTSLYRVWREHKDHAYRLGAAVTALVLQTDYARTANE